MPVASIATIVERARDIKRDCPTLNTGHHASPRIREALENLGTDVGLSMNDVGNLSDNDLIGIYLVATKDGMAALRVADRIKMRLSPILGEPMNNFSKPAPPSWPAPQDGSQDPKPAPVAAPQVDQRAIKAMIDDVIKSGVLAPLQAALEGVDADLREDFKGLMATHEQGLIDGFEEAATRAAHAAVVEALKNMTPTRLDISLNDDTPPVSLGLVHRDTAKIITSLTAGVNVYLHGPAGSGKTTVARKCAEAFMLQFYFAAKVESEYQLIGFKDAKGETVRTQFREAYEHGGVFLFDEMDASSPSAVVALNAALANGVCPFPDGIVQRHANFHCIGAGNTKLTGANRQYAGRNQLDAASVDRFAFIEFGYDDELELALAADHAWAKHVQKVRKVIADRGLNHLVTPRATYDGCKLLAKGLDWDTVDSMCVYKGLDADTIAQIKLQLR